MREPALPVLGLACWIRLRPTILLQPSCPGQMLSSLSSASFSPLPRRRFSSSYSIISSLSALICSWERIINRGLAVVNVISMSEGLS